jgi:hypothetical protein
MLPNNNYNNKDKLMDPIPSDADDTSKLHKTQVHNTTQNKI